MESAERSVGGGCGEMESAVCAKGSATRIGVGKGRVQRG